jgi:HEAT repeat protein
LTLNSLGDKSGVPTMMDDLTTATGRDRNNVAVALRIMKDERAIPTLRTALKDKTPYVRAIAVATLGELKAAKAYDDIVAVTKDKESVNPGGGLNCIHYSPADMACYALAALGDEKAIPVLIGLVADNDLQGSAAQALEAMTRQKFGRDPEKWKAWWKDRR